MRCSVSVLDVPIVYVNGSPVLVASGVLLNDGYSKDRILRLIRKATIDHRASEAAMTVADWSVAIDRVEKRLSQ